MSDKEELNSRLEASFARWLEGTPFSSRGMAILGMRPVNREKLYRVYAEELLRLKNGKFASFEDVYGDLMKESGVDPAWAANISPEAARFMEECEKRFLAANYRYLERGVEHAWKDILEGDYDCGVPEILRAARSGHGRALLYASRLFRNGVGVEKDPQKAMDALEAAAETDCGAACVEYGMALVDGRYGEADDVTGKKFLEKGVRLAAEKGVLAGYPVVGLKATLLDGSYHPVDSSEMAFIMAAKLAYKAAMPEAGPVILEPIHTLKAHVPNDNTGDIMGDVTKRRGRVLGMEPDEDGLQTIIAEVPLAELANFTTFIRQTTQGRGWFTTEFARYETLPEMLVPAVVEQAKKLGNLDEAADD